MSQAKDTSRSRAGILGMVALVGSALVGFNSLVSGCSSDRAARNAAQLHRIEQRERFWTDAMKNFSEVVKDRGDPAGGDEKNPNWMIRCSLLALRTAPFVENARLTRMSADGTEEMSADLFEYNSRVDKLQQAFVDQISNPAFVDPACNAAFATARLEAIRRQDDEIRKAAQNAGKGADVAPGYVPSPPVAEAIATRQDLIALTPVSENGWDIDLFWCERPADADSQRNFDEALDLAHKLATEQQKGNVLQGNRLGRIRLRMLAATLAGEPQYSPYVGHRVAVSDAKNEQSLIAALTALDPELDDLFRDETSTAPRTPWYVSLFYCAHGQADTPADAAATALAL